MWVRGKKTLRWEKNLTSLGNEVRRVGPRLSEGRRDAVREVGKVSSARTLRTTAMIWDFKQDFTDMI